MMLGRTRCRTLSAKLSVDGRLFPAKPGGTVGGTDAGRDFASKLDAMMTQSRCGCATAAASLASRFDRERLCHGHDLFHEVSPFVLARYGDRLNVNGLAKQTYPVDQPEPSSTAQISFLASGF